MLVLDSDVLSIIQRGEGEAYEKLSARLMAEDDDVVTTIVSFEEQMRGWLALVARYQDVTRQVLPYAHLHTLLEDYSSRPVLDFDDAAAAEFSRLRKLKVRVGTMDLKIASIVLVHDATLITRNISDFGRVPELRAYDWAI